MNVSAVTSLSPDAPDASHGEFTITVNGNVVAVRDRTPNARQILTSAALHPASDYVLIELTKPGTKSIGLAESVDLGKPGREAFRAFKSDRLYLFTVDELGYEWGEGSIAVSELREIAAVPADRVLLLEREGEPDRVLPDDGHVSVSHAGTEHLRSASRLVAVFLDEDPTERLIPRGAHKTEELLTLLKVKAGYLLNVLGHDGQIKELQPGQLVHVKDGMHFYSQAPAGGAS